jgi:hypothetical protein
MASSKPTGASYSVWKIKTWVLTRCRKITELQVRFMTCHGSFKFGIKSLTAIGSNYCPALHNYVFSVLTNPLPGIQAHFSAVSQQLYPKCLQAGKKNNNFYIKNVFWLKTKY